MSCMKNHPTFCLESQFPYWDGRVKRCVTIIFMCVCVFKCQKSCSSDWIVNVGTSMFISSCRGLRFHSGSNSGQIFCWLLTSYPIIRCRLITWTIFCAIPNIFEQFCQTALHIWWQHCLNCILVRHWTCGMLTCAFNAGRITSWTAECALLHTACNCKSAYDSRGNVFHPHSLLWPSPVLGESTWNSVCRSLMLDLQSLWHALRALRALLMLASRGHFGVRSNFSIAAGSFA